MRLSRLLISALVGFLIFGLYIWLKIPSFFPLTSSQEWRYHQIVGAHSGYPLLNHFPAEIPKEATKMRFYFQPGVMQGGTTFQLRLALPRSTIADLDQTYSKLKTKSFWGGDINWHMSGKDGMPTTFFHTNDNAETYENRLFPPDYEIMIFDPLLTESERSQSRLWNHGQSHGVAISRQRNEIVYWAQWW